jgi:penicillin-binding protein 1A
MKEYRFFLNCFFNSFPLEQTQNISPEKTPVLLRKSKWFKRMIRLTWTLTILLLVGLPLYIFAVISNPGNLFGAMPSLRDIENPQQDISSEVLSADGVSLGRYFRYHRSMVTYDDLSEDLINTLLISEDHRFHEHSGMDFEAFLRVFKGILTFSRQGGGSTLTQQTAKNLFRTREHELNGKLATMGPLAVLIGKTKEWIIAVRLEETFTKQEILALYLNTVPFSNNAYGVKVAAETYFDKEPSQLNIYESALLIGMLQGNSIYNPVRHPQRATSKRNQVIDKLFRHGYISSIQVRDSIKAHPLGLNFTVLDHNEGLAPYFRSIVKRELQAWCEANGYNLEESGLKIYTTIDSRLQRFAETAMKGHMARLQKMFDRDWAGRNPWIDDNGNELRNFASRKIKQSEVYRLLRKKYGDDKVAIERTLNEEQSFRVFSWSGPRDTVFSFYDSLQYYNRFLQTGVMAMEPETGAVKAWVGGIDHTYFQYDHVRQAKRQPGSTFKPFLYGLAIENGFSPCQPYRDLSPKLTVNGEPYEVSNANGTKGDGKIYTMRQALAKSLNTVSMQLMDELRPDNVAAFANKVGIESPLDPVYSLALGTSDVSLYEMVGAYCSFVNHGIHIKPYYITRIEDKNSNVIENFLPVARQVLDENTAYGIVHMLRGGVEEVGGSSRGLSDEVKADNEVGGKTGTTDNGSDGWFIGITPNLVAGVWVGGDERSIHFPRWGESSGGRAALPIFDNFMKQVYANPATGYPKGQFKRPEGFNINLDCDRYTTQDSLFNEQEGF